MKFTRVLFLVFLTTKVTADEPRCSKYDFEEKVLEKLVRMEFNVGQYKVDLGRIKSDIDHRLDEIESLNSVVNNAVKEFDSKLETKQDTIQPVVFKARLRSDTAVSTGQTIIYPFVMLNIGDGYDSSSGIFTAPVNGAYMFDIVLCPYSNKYVNVGILIDDEQNTEVLFYSRSGSPCSSANAVAVLQTGQKVKVAVLFGTSGGAMLNGDSARWNTFSGVLVHE